MSTEKLSRLAGIDRRGFLRAGSACAASLGMNSLMPAGLITGARSAPLNKKRLFFIFLRGGNDGVNTVIPHGDPDYNRKNRPDLFIAPDDGVELALACFCGKVLAKFLKGL